MGPGLGAEPANAVTNLAFLAAAWVSWRLAHRSGRVSPGVTALIGLIPAIGLGSALFHAFATTWTGVLDLLPILAFQLYFLWLYCRRVVFLSPYSSALLVVFLLIATLVGQVIPLGNQWSLTYIPSFILLLGLGGHHYSAQKREPLTLPAAAGVFALALVFRSLDGVACPLFPQGTHFLWHVLVAVTLYLLLKALVPNLQPGPPSSAPDGAQQTVRSWH